MKARREEWQEQQKTMDRNRLVFLDESGVNLNMTRRYGRAIGKARVYDYVPLKTPKNTTLLSSIRLEMLWSKIKAFLRKRKARETALLSNAIAEAYSSISCGDILGWFSAAGYVHSFMELL